MALSTLVIREPTQLGTGLEVDFDFEMPAKATSEIVVYVDDTVVSTALYTVVLDGDNGGTVTFDTAPLSGVSIDILRIVALDQELDLANNVAVSRETIEDAFDHLVMQTQQLAYDLDKAPKLHRTHDLTGITLPGPETLTLVADGSKVLRWNAAGTNLGLVEIADSDDAVGLLSSTVNTSTLAGLPSAGNAGSLFFVTNALKGLYIDNGSLFRPVGNRVYQADDYGVVGDDSTDNLAVLQALVDTVNTAGGGTIFIPNGTYQISAPLVIYDNIHLVGQSRNGATLKCASGFGNNAIVRPETGIATANVTIENMTFDGNRAANLDTGQAGIQGRYNHCLFRDLTLTGFDGHTILLTGETIGGVSHNNRIFNCKISDYGSADAGGVGIFLFKGAHHNVVAFCEVTNEDTPGQGGSGIAEDDISSTGDSLQTHHNIFAHNWIHDAANGIGGQGQEDSVYMGNIIHDMTGIGIDIVYGNAGDNVRTDLHPKRVTITGNTINTCGSLGMGLNGEQLNVTGNTITSVSQGIRFDAQGELAHNICANNIIRDCTTNGIFIRRRGDVLITGNTIQTVGEYGIKIDNTGFGFEVQDVSILNNYIEDVQFDGIIITQDANPIRRVNISQNMFRNVGLTATATYYVVRTNSTTGPVTCAYNTYDGTFTNLLGFANIVVTAGYAHANTSLGTGIRVVTLANDATPVVRNSDLFITGGTTAITNLLGARVGKTVTILSAHAITITDGANINLAGSTNFVMAATDTLTLTSFDGSVWTEVSRSDNS